MLALSPLSHTFGFPLEDEMITYNQHNWESTDPLLGFNTNEWNHLDSFCSASSPEIVLDNPCTDSAGTSSDPPTSKKLNHNASERDRRHKLNNQYATLRSLLPRTDLKKKLSIPNTVSQALKYIPKLENEVKRLIQRKEEISTNISQLKKDKLASPPRPYQGVTRGLSLATVSTSQISNNEAVIQICLSEIKKGKIPEVLENLEGVHLQIIDATSFASCENKIFYTIHVQAKECQRVNYEWLDEKIMALFSDC